jgi:hypothetical protein
LHHGDAASQISFFTCKFFTENNITIAPIHSTFLCFPD